MEICECSVVAPLREGSGVRPVLTIAAVAASALRRSVAASRTLNGVVESPLRKVGCRFAIEGPATRWWRDDGSRYRYCRTGFDFEQWS